MMMKEGIRVLEHFLSRLVNNMFDEFTTES